MAVSEHPGQPNRAPIDERHPPASAIDAEYGVSGGHAQVAEHRELQPAGDRVPLDRGDRRLGERHACWPHWPGERHVRLDSVAVASGDRFQIGARAEGALRAGEDRDAQFGSGLELLEGLAKRVGGRTVHGVPRLRSVDRDDEDVLPGLGDDGGGVVRLHAANVPGANVGLRPRAD